MDQVARSFIPRECLRDVACNPFSGWMSCGIDPDKVSAGQPNDDPMQNVPPGIQIMLWGGTACAERDGVAAMSVSLMGAYLPSKRPYSPFGRSPCAYVTN